MSNIGDYEETYANFGWDTPERFNFGRDVVDRWAAQDRVMVLLGKEQTAPYRYPRQIGSIEELPKTTSRKIRRVELRG